MYIISMLAMLNYTFCHTSNLLHQLYVHNYIRVVFRQLTFGDTFHFTVAMLGQRLTIFLVLLVIVCYAALSGIYGI